MYKITFTYKGFIAAILYNECDTAALAIDSAKMNCVARYDNVRAEKVED